MNANTLLLSVLRETESYKALLDGIEKSSKRAKPAPLCVTGLSEGITPVFLTALAADRVRENCRVLLLFSTEKEASDEALRLTAEGVRAYHYPARDYNFNIMTASRDYEHRRLLVLSELLFSNEAFVVCATAEAVLQITVAPEDLIHLSKNIDADLPIDLKSLSETLLLGGYTRVELVEGPGQFAIRGGIADIFPPSETPVRIELFGDEIDRIGTFDPITQRFISTLDGKVIITPAHEIMLDESKREEIIKICEKQIARLSKKEEDNKSAVEILKGEISQLKTNLDIGFTDKYLPYLCENSDCFFDYFDGLLVLCDTSQVKDRAENSEKLLLQSISDMIETGELLSKSGAKWINKWDRIETAASVMPSVLIDPFMRSHPGMVPCAEFSFLSRHISPYNANFQLLSEDLKHFTENSYRVAILCANEADAKEISKNLVEAGYSCGIATGGAEFFGTNSKSYPIALLYGESDGGYEITDEKFAFLNFSGVSEGAARLYKTKQRKAKNKKKQSILSYSDLSAGDLVVHEAYGIGLYEGVETLTAAGITRDYVKIKYAGSDVLYLPVDRLDRISKYIGAGTDGENVKLSKMGGADWHRAKSKASASAREMAKELIELYAKRKKAQGIAFPPDDDMTAQFAAAFPYEETDSQLTAIEEIRQDMEESCPMERIICGDVGYGKTEVALRAAFKAVMGGKQVAIVAPTTILAYQHYQTALNRFRGFPISIDMLSRFRTKQQQDVSVRKLKRGETDIVIGTHRIFSSDIEFQKLGLMIIDEEQRFGVAQKEKLKKNAIGADMLTLTATPIPRTLNMALGGILDMSILDDVPGLRSPVQTYVMEHDEKIIAEAIKKELSRGGQVFYLNNNIEQLYYIRTRIENTIPGAVVAVAHGRMEREELENIWAALVRGEIDVLVCTTIIETGVDVPNANTLIIENADRFGLSQLHQLRGRVGRSSRRAYAYFTYPKMKQLTEIADKRLRALKEYAAFGAGFKIALRDLEIRGAGNLLGSQQHGHMQAVGYDMYMKLLEEAVIEEKGEAVKKTEAECVVNLNVNAYVGKNYIKDSLQRMEMYRKISKIQNEEDFSDVIDELCDRFGEPTGTSLNLLRIALIHGMGQKAGFTKIDEREKEIVMLADAPNLSKIQSIEAKMPGAIRVTFGAGTLISIRKPKGVNVCDFVTDFLKEYLSD